MDSALAHRSDRVRGRGPRPSVPPAQALPPADTTDLPLHTMTDNPASQRRTAPPRTSPLDTTAALWPWLRRRPPPPCARPTRHRGTHSPITQRGGDHGVHRETVDTYSTEPQRNASSDVAVSRSGRGQAPSDPELTARSSSAQNWQRVRNGLDRSRRPSTDRHVCVSCLPSNRRPQPPRRT